MADATPMSHFVLFEIGTTNGALGTGETNEGLVERHIENEETV